MQRVIRISRQNEAFVLVGISSRGSRPLDLDLLGTENEQAYAASLSQNEIAKSKANTDDISNEDWRSVLSWVLLRERPTSQEQRQLIDRVYVEASVDPKQGIVLTFRQNIQGLTPRIGSLSLKPDDTKELDLFEWAGLLCNITSTTEERFAELQSEQDTQQKTIDKLSAQLDDFIEAKKQHDDELLEKFRQLLNSKKLKIRDQQRLLAGAKVDAEAAKQVRKARSSVMAGASTRGKRKVASDVEMADIDAAQTATESEDDFETAATPQQSEMEEDDTLPWTQKPRHESNDEDIPERPRPGSLHGTHREALQTTDAGRAPTAAEGDDDDETDDEL